MAKISYPERLQRFNFTLDWGERRRTQECGEISLGTQRNALAANLLPARFGCVASQIIRYPDDL
jgi:hypothetical protein